VAVKGQNSTDRFREILAQLISPVPFDDAGNRENRETFPDRDRTGNRPASP